MSTANPCLAVITRGNRVESRHRGAACVVAASGAVMAAAGDIDQPIFPRSAVKPLQALALVESGAADRFQVSEEELALACASHAGTPAHLLPIARWLERLGLCEHDLACGPHLPLDEAAAHDLIRRRQPPTRLHNNCSGKHAGMLTLARHLGAPVVGYEQPHHPVQEAVEATLREMGGLPRSPLPWAVDGCGVPTFAIPLRALALAFARLGAPHEVTPLRARACRRIIAAMIGHPRLVAGENRFDTRVMATAAGTIVCKGGAEGVAAAAVPARGIGLAVKIDDGAKRAAEAVAADLMLRVGRPSPAAASVLQGYARLPVYTFAGRVVGEARAVIDGLTRGLES